MRYDVINCKILIYWWLTTLYYNCPYTKTLNCTPDTFYMPYHCSAICAPISYIRVTINTAPGMPSGTYKIITYDSYHMRLLQCLLCTKLAFCTVTCSSILVITWISWSDRLGKVLFKSTRNCIIPVIDKYLQSGYLEYIALGWIVTTPEQDNQMTLDDLFV